MRTLRGDFRRSEGREYLKLDRVGGDLFGLQRAMIELGVGIGDHLFLFDERGQRATARVLAIDTGREGEFQIELEVSDNLSSMFRNASFVRVTAMA